MLSDADFMFLGGIFAGLFGGALIGAWLGIKFYKVIKHAERVYDLELTREARRDH